MKRNLILSAVTIGALSLTAACSKSTPANTTETTETTTQTTNTAEAPATSDTPNTAGDNTTGPTGNATGAVVSAVGAVQDAASSAVGLASAAMPTDPQGFVTAAAISDMYEQDAAKIAQQRSTSSQIKTFASKMIHDHSRNNSELRSVLKNGAKTNLTYPTQLDQRRQGLIDNLKSASAADFNKTYLGQQVSAHQEAETLMRGYSQHGDDGALKQFASKTAPIVQQHLDMAKTLDGDAKFTAVVKG